MHERVPASEVVEPLSENSVRLAERLAELERAAGKDFPEAWADQSAENMRDVAELVRAASSPDAFEGWRDRLSDEVTASNEYGVAPNADQLDALVRLSRHSIAMFDTRWDFAIGSPARLEQLGYVLRSHSPIEVWNSFFRNREHELVALFGPALFTDLENVAIDRVGQFSIVRFLRRHEGVQLANEFFDVYVTNDSSSMGAGVVWRDLASV